MMARFTYIAKKSKFELINVLDVTASTLQMRKLRLIRGVAHRRLQSEGQKQD